MTDRSRKALTSQRTPKCVATLLVLTIICATTIQAQHHHDEELHFSHPLITESPSPDTKVRFDYFYRRLRAGERATEHSPRVEFEYAFRPSFSIEVNVSYTFRKVGGEPTISQADSLDVALKFANSALKEHHVLLVYGVEVGLPTGSDSKGIGSSHIIEVAPYFGAGLKKEKVEVVGFTSISVPVRKRTGDEDATTLGYLPWPSVNVGIYYIFYFIQPSRVWAGPDC